MSRGASSASGDDPISLRSPDALQGLLLLPAADAQQHGEHGHTPLVSGDDSDPDAAGVRAPADTIQRVGPGDGGHLLGQRNDAQANAYAQTNGGGDDGRGQHVTAAAAHRPRRGRAPADDCETTGASSGIATAQGSHLAGHRHAQTNGKTLRQPSAMQQLFDTSLARLRETRSSKPCRVPDPYRGWPYAHAADSCVGVVR